MSHRVISVGYEVKLGSGLRMPQERLEHKQE